MCFVRGEGGLTDKLWFDSRMINLNFLIGLTKNRRLDQGLNVKQ